MRVYFAHAQPGMDMRGCEKRMSVALKGISSRHPSPAGQLLQIQNTWVPLLEPICWRFVQVNGPVLTPPIAGRPAPTHTKHLGPLVGASLLAIRAGQRACAHATHRRQASSHKYMTDCLHMCIRPADYHCPYALNNPINPVDNQGTAAMTKVPRKMASKAGSTATATSRTDLLNMADEK